jgi:hypothetical protein
MPVAIAVACSESGHFLGPAPKARFDDVVADARSHGRLTPGDPYRRVPAERADHCRFT